MIHRHLLDALNASEEGLDALKHHAHVAARERGHRTEGEANDAPTTAPLVTPDTDDRTE